MSQSMFVDRTKCEHLVEDRSVLDHHAAFSTVYVTVICLSCGFIEETSMSPTYIGRL